MAEAVYLLNTWYAADEDASSDDLLYNGSLYWTLEGAQTAALEDLVDLADGEVQGLEWEEDGTSCWLATSEDLGARYSIRLMPINGKPPGALGALRNLVTAVEKLNDPDADPDMVGAGIDAALDEARNYL